MTCRIEYVPIPPTGEEKAISSLVDVMKGRYSIAADTTRAFADLSKAGVKHDEAKHDEAKIDPSFVLESFPRALMAIAAVAEYGARKYTRDGWKTVDNGIARYGAALVRHQLAQHIEGPYDGSDSGLSHLAQQAWNTLATLEKAIELGAIEIRRGNDIVEGKPILGTAKKIG